MRKQESLSIGDLAKATGTKAVTIAVSLMRYLRRATLTQNPERPSFPFGEEDWPRVETAECPPWRSGRDSSIRKVF
jgi:hypothetical protein